jgi:hydrogenase maturation protease
MANICVMAVGNVLTGDDGLGPYVLELLDAGYDFPAEVQLFDVGTPGIDLTMFIEPLDALVVIDAVKADAAPGTVKTYHRSDLLKGSLPLVMSPHEPSLREAMMRLQLTGTGPTDVTLIGAVPAHLTLTESLSPAVKASVPVIIELVLAELARLGVSPTPRPTPRPPVFWWEKPQAAAPLGAS